jgi:hypothetical protein
MSSLALGFSTTACTDQTFVDFEGTNNTSVTAANLLSTTRGYRGGIWTLSGTALKYQNAATKPLLNATGRLCDGSSYSSGAGASGLEYLTSTGVSYVKYDFGEVATDTISAGVWFYTTLPDGDSSIFDPFTIGGVGGGDGANAYFYKSGSTRAFNIEANSGHGSDVNINTATWYWIVLTYNKTGNQVLKIYDTSHNLVGSSSTASAGTTSPAYIVLGDSNNSATTGYLLYFDSLRIRFDGTEAAP